MSTSAIWRGLLAILKAIGRWVADRIRTRGQAWVLAVMEDRIEAFERRRNRAKTARRRTWLDGRIRRWKKAQKWILVQVRGELYLCCSDHAAAIAQLPLVSPQEREPTRRAAA